MEIIERYTMAYTEFGKLEVNFKPNFKGYRGSPRSADFGTWKKGYCQKFSTQS